MGNDVGKNPKGNGKNEIEKRPGAMGWAEALLVAGLLGAFLPACDGSGSSRDGSGASSAEGCRAGDSDVSSCGAGSHDAVSYGAVSSGAVSSGAVSNSVVPGGAVPSSGAGSDAEAGGTTLDGSSETRGAPWTDPDSMLGSAPALLDEDAGAAISQGKPSVTSGGDEAMGEDSTTSHASAIDGGELQAVCRDTAGFCDPVGECALSDCNYQETGKACAYTPRRASPFLCLVTGDYEPYRPCDSDDVCAPGSVCISKVALLKDGSFYRRPGAVCRETCRRDDDCGEGEWCAPATDDNNQVIADMRVCHRYCQTESDCYEGPGDEEVRCSNSVEGAPASTYECSRYRPPLEQASSAESTSDVTAALNLSRAGSPDGQAQGDQVEAPVFALRLELNTTPACVFNEDCTEGHDCVGGSCQQRCARASDCGGAECVVVDGRGVCGVQCDVPPGAECAPLPLECGCQMGQTCRLDATLTPRCAEPGPNGPMSWCNTPSDCGSGLSCIAGLCRPVCIPGGDGCGALQGECLLGVSRVEGDVYACGGNCDPLASASDNGCGAGALCIPGFNAEHHSQALCVAQRAGHAPKTVGQGCDTDYDCASGLGCDDRHVCAPWCRSSEDCNGAECRLGAGPSGRVHSRFARSPADPVGLCSAAR